MKTFFFTTLFRFFVITWAWVYLSSYQSDMLYTALQTANPATAAVTECMSGVDTLSGALHTKLDTIMTKLEQQNTITTTISTTGTGTTTGSIKVVPNLFELPSQNN